MYFDSTIFSFVQKLIQKSLMIIPENYVSRINIMALEVLSETSKLVSHSLTSQ